MLNAREFKNIVDSITEKDRFKAKYKEELKEIEEIINNFDKALYIKGQLIGYIRLDSDKNYSALVNYLFSKGYHGEIEEVKHDEDLFVYYTYYLNLYILEDYKEEEKPKGFFKRLFG